MQKRRLRKDSVISVLLIIAIILVVILGFVYLLTSERFGVKTFEIIGADRLDPAEIAKMADIPYKTNVFRISSRAIGERIMESPYVDKVKVEKKPPSSILITVTEKRVIGYVKRDGISYVLGEDGAVLESGDKTRVRPTDPKIELEHINTDEKVMIGPEAVTLISKLLTTNYYDRVRGLDLTRQNPIVILDGGGRVEFDASGDIEYQFRFLEEIIQSNEESGKKIQKVIFKKDKDPVVETKDLGD